MRRRPPKQIKLPGGNRPTPRPGPPKRKRPSKNILFNKGGKATKK